MLCRAYVVLGNPTKKFPLGKPKKSTSLAAALAKQFPERIPANAVRCTGTIQAFVGVEGQGCCEMCYSEDWAINYACSDCGNTHFPDLPQTHNLNAWLTELIKKLP